MSRPPTPERTLTEQPLRTHPGWTRLQWKAPDGHDLQTQFRGPGGEIISKHEFSKRVKSGEIATIDPESGATKTPPAVKQALASDPPPLASTPPSPTPPPAGESQAPQTTPAFDLPDARPAGGRTAPGQASAAELSLTAQIALTIVTSLLALVTQTPELVMSEQEASALAVPLANLAAKSEINRRFGRYLASSSDYTLLGYALYAYGYRVFTQVAARQAAEAAQAPQRPTPMSGVTGGVYAPPAQVARSAGPAQPTTSQPAASVRAANGGILGAVNGAVPAESARIVGFNPLPPTGSG